MTTITSRRPSDGPKPAYCRGCRALVGQHYGARKPTIYCVDPICPLVPRTNAFEERDGIITLLHGVRGFTKENLATLAGISHQRIAQVLIEGSVSLAPQ